LSELKVEVVEIASCVKHPGADRLSLVTLKGMDWVVITSLLEDGNHRYDPGDKAIYIPIDSVLPEKLETFLFPEGSAITLTKSRIKTIKIRGAYSQGMILDFSQELENLYPGVSAFKKGDDLTQFLGVKKYEPPEESIPYYKGLTRNLPKNNPNFDKYTDLQNLKKYPDVFGEGDTIYCSEKLHGTSTRLGLVKLADNRWWKRLIRKIEKLLKISLLPEYEYVWGTRNLQLQQKLVKKVYYSKDIYTQIFNQYKDKLEKDVVLYGEIVGDGIQKGYTYGCQPGEWKFFCYDVKVNGGFLSYSDFVKYCDDREIPRVPELYVGPFDKEFVSKLRDGKSLIGHQKVREGIVIKPILESMDPFVGRKALKYISDAYLLKDNTDFH
jgi:RNA ligase (TIGR02306 family)